MLWFADKMISIPHISYIEELEPDYNSDPPMLPDISEEEHRRALKKVAQIREELKSKLKRVD